MEDQNKNSLPEQEVEITNPIEKNRRPTDQSFLFIFLVVIIIWLGVGISALCAKERHHEDGSRDEVMQFLTYCRSFINAPIISFSWTYLLVLFTSIWFSILCIVLNRQFTKFFLYIGMVIYIIYVIYIVLIIFGSIDLSSKNKPSQDHKPQDFNFNKSSSLWIPLFFLQVLLMMACAVSFFKVDQETIYKIIKDCCRIVLGSPLLMVFCAFISLLEYAVLSFTVNAFVSDFSSDRNVLIIELDLIVLCLGALWALTFIYNFALMVVSEYTISYYWKNKIGIGGIIAQISRFHLGTIAFSSTLLVPYCCSFVQALKHTQTWKNTEGRPLYCVNKIFLTLTMPCTALYYSSIYGAGFIRSSQKTFDVVLRRSLLYLATHGVVDILLSFAMYIVITPAPIIFFLSMAISEYGKEIGTRRKELEPQMLEQIYLLLHGICFPIATFGFLMYYSVKALLINKIVILNKENQYTEGNNEMFNHS